MDTGPFRGCVCLSLSLSLSLPTPAPLQPGNQALLQLEAETLVNQRHRGRQQGFCIA
jgi:hypothetical protein